MLRFTRNVYHQAFWWGIWSAGKDTILVEIFLIP